MERDDGSIDSFDDLFEPFELDEPPPPGEEPPRYEPEGSYIACPSCGTRNKPQNRHCEACGARVAQGPLPVAPQPMLRTTPGARALGILTAVVLVVALLALIVNVVRGGGDPDPDSTVAATGAVGEDGTQETAATTPQLPVEPLTPTSVTASSELPGFPASALIDADPTNYWNDESQKGVDATLTFFFAQPVQIRQIVIHNLDDERAFARNYRIKGLQVDLDDLAQTIIRELEDQPGAQVIDINSLETQTVTMKVTDTYQGQPFDGDPPFEELALQQVEFFGKVVGG